MLYNILMQLNITLVAFSLFTPEHLGFIVIVSFNLSWSGGGGRDSSVGKSSASQAWGPGLNPSGGLSRVTQCMDERGRDHQL